MTDENRNLLAEAVDIADGKTLMIGSTKHVKALVARMRAVAAKLDLIPAEPTDGQTWWRFAVDLNIAIEDARDMLTIEGQNLSAGRDG